jgi:hypothetical protein
MPKIGSADVKLSEKILGSVITAWKVGGWALAMLVIGAAAFLLAFWLALWGHDFLAFCFLAGGASMIGLVGYKFYVEAILPAKRASERLEQNTELMDTVQEAAITLTDIISQLNDYALLNADRIVSTVDGLKDKINQFPGGNLITNSNYFAKGDNLAKGIRNVAATSRNAVQEIRDSVNKADITRISVHLENLKSVKQTIETELLNARNQ